MDKTTHSPSTRKLLASLASWAVMAACVVLWLLLLSSLALGATPTAVSIRDLSGAASLDAERSQGWRTDNATPLNAWLSSGWRTRKAPLAIDGRGYGVKSTVDLGELESVRISGAGVGPLRAEDEYTTAGGASRLVWINETTNAGPIAEYAGPSLELVGVMFQGRAARTDVDALIASSAAARVGVGFELSGTCTAESIAFSMCGIALEVNGGVFHGRDVAWSHCTTPVKVDDSAQVTVADSAGLGADAILAAGGSAEAPNVVRLVGGSIDCGPLELVDADSTGVVRVELSGVVTDDGQPSDCRFTVTAGEISSVENLTGTQTIAAGRIVLGDVSRFSGAGSERTIVTAPADSTGRLIATVDLDTYLASAAKWSDAGMPMRARLMHFGVDGAGGNSDAPHENGNNYDGDLEYELTGIDAYSPGARFHDIQLYKIRGTGLRYNHGQVGTRPAPRPYIDQESPWFKDIYVMNCLRGLWLQSGTDAVIENAEIGGCRDEGLLMDAGSTFIEFCHTYGNGTGVQLNNSAHIATLQVDADMTGLVVAATAAYTSIDKLLIQLCYKVGADLAGATEIGTTRIFSIPNNATGVVIRGNGGARIGGGRTDITGNAAVGFKVQQWHTDITQRIFGDSSKTAGNAQTAMEFGVASTMAPSGCDIELFVYGCNKGVDLKNIGYSNRITIRYRDCANPIVTTLTAGQIDDSNTIRLVNVATGATVEDYEP